MYFKLLKTLSAEEFYEFRFFLKHVLKARLKCLLFYENLEKKFIENNENWAIINLDQEDFFFSIYEKKMPENTTLLRELGSEFFKHLKHYCAYLRFRKDEQEYYSKYLYDREENHLFDIEFRKLIATYKKKVGTGSALKQFEFMELYIKKRNLNLFAKQINMNQFLGSFINFIDLKKMQLLCIIEQNNLVKKYNINESYHLYFSKNLNKHHLNDHSINLYNMYYQSILMLQNKKDNYEILKRSIYHNIYKLSVYDKRVLILSLVLYCNFVAKSATADICKYLNEEKQSHYFYMYKKGVLMNGKYIKTIHIKNVCLSYILRTKKNGKLKLAVAEARKIIEKSKQYIIPEYKESTYDFNLGLFYFYTDNYDKSIKLFNKKNQYANYYFTCDANLYSLKCYFKTSKADFFGKKVAAFRESLRRDKYLSKHEKSCYQNSIKALVILKKIKGNIQFKYKYDRTRDIEKLKKFMHKNATQSRVWLYEQLNELST